jgi:uncharacterized transporter YbjL
MSDLKCPLFMDVHIPKRTSDELRALGYDVLTVQQYQGTSRPGKGISDEMIVDIAIERRRIVVTENANHFERLHQLKPDHKGIIICKATSEWTKMAKEIDRRIKEAGVLLGQLIQVSVDDSATQS